LREKPHVMLSVDYDYEEDKGLQPLVFDYDDERDVRARAEGRGKKERRHYGGE